MALNIKPLFPLDHPEVTKLEDRIHLSVAVAQDENFSKFPAHDQNLEKYFGQKYKKFKKSKFQQIRKINII